MSKKIIKPLIIFLFILVILSTSFLIIKNYNTSRKEKIKIANQKRYEEIKNDINKEMQDYIYNSTQMQKRWTNNYNYT